MEKKKLRYTLKLKFYIMKDIFKKPVYLVWICIFCTAGSLTGCSLLPSGPSAADSGEKTEAFYFTYADNQPEDYPTTLAAHYFADLVEEASDGRIHILVRADGKLGDEASAVRQLSYGGIDFARASVLTLAEYTPEIGVLMLPYLYRDSDHMWQVLEGPIGTQFLKGLEGTGITALSWYDAGARSFYTAGAPLRSPEDMEGLHIRIQDSDLMADFISLFGAVPVRSVYADVYEMLELGEIDGAENNLPSYAAEQHYLLADCYTLDEHVRIPELQLVSSETWNQLSESDQELIVRCAKVSAVYERKLWQRYEARALEQVTEAGCRIIRLTEDELAAFQELAGQLYQEYFPEQKELISQIQAIP